MILSFVDKNTESVFLRRYVRRFHVNLQRQAKVKLDQINAATEINQLRIPPSNHLEALKGDLREFYSIRINQQWRVVFRWKDGHAEEVKIIDYH